MDVGPVNCQLLRLLSKKHNDSLHERTAVFASRRQDTGEVVILKLRHQYVHFILIPSIPILPTNCIS